MAESGWREKVDPRSGRKYYVSATTGASSWTAPAPASQPSDSASPGLRAPPPLSALTVRPATAAAQQAATRKPPPLSELSVRVSTSTKAASGKLSRTPPALPPTRPQQARGQGMEMEMESIGQGQQKPQGKAQSTNQSNPLRRRLTEDEEQGHRPDEKDGGGASPKSKGCCLCGFERRRSCCLCFWPVFLLIVGALVFIFWPRCLTVKAGPDLRVTVDVQPQTPGAAAAPPEVALGTDITIRSDNYWSLSIDRIEVVAVYRANSIGSVELSQGLQVPRQGVATFPVDITPGFEDPARSAVDFAADCAVPLAQQQGVVGAAAVPPLPAGGATPTTTSGSGSPTWPVDLVITVELWSWLPTVTVTIPDIAVPCAPGGSTVEISDPSSGGDEAAGEESACLIG